MYTAALLLALLPAAFAAPLIVPRDVKLVPNKFIVKMKPEASKADLAKAKALLSKTVDHDYAFGGFNGFAGSMDKATVSKLQALKSVRTSYEFPLCCLITNR
jgi:hypothetical protein